MAAGWAASLTRFPPGTRASFLYSPEPGAILLDLAVQAAGLVAVPISEGQSGQVEIEGERVVLPSWEEAERAGADRPEAERLADGGVAMGERVLSQGDLGAAVERLDLQVPTFRKEHRHILVLSGFAGDPAERLLLAWATVTGAALLLEPEPAHHVPTAIWARPTVFPGTAADRARLREAVEREQSGFRIFRRRLPFGRLRAVVGTEGELPEEEKVFWEQRGVKAFAAERQDRGI